SVRGGCCCSRRRRASLRLWVGLAEVGPLALGQQMARDFHYHHYGRDGAPLWFDFPSVPVITAFLIGGVSLFVFCLQYLTARRVVSGILSIVLVVSLSGIAGFFPVPSYTYRSFDDFGEGGAGWDLELEALQRDLKRICPLDQRWIPTGTENGRRVMSLERFLPSSEHSRVSAASALSYEGRRIGRLSGHKGPFSWQGASSDSLALAAGIEGPLKASYGWAKHRTLQIDEPDFRGFSQEKEATLTSEVIYGEVTPTLLMSVPLRIGEVFRQGFYGIEVKDVRYVEGHMEVEVTQSFPVPKFVRSGVDVPTRALGAWTLRFFHYPTETLIEIRESETKSERNWGPFAQKTLFLSSDPRVISIHLLFRECLFHEANFDANEWALVGTHETITAARSIPFEVPDLRLNRRIPESPDDLPEKFAKVRRDDFESTEDFLWRVLSLSMDPHSRRENDLMNAALESLTPEDVPVLVSVGYRFTGDYWKYTARLIAAQVVRLAQPEHRDLILAHHEIDFDLFGAIRKYGWEEEALPGMIRKARDRRGVPDSWDAFFLEVKPDDPEFLTNLATRRFYSKALRGELADLPGVSMAHVTERYWQQTMDFSGSDFFDALETQIRAGNRLGLVRLLYLLRSGLQGKEDPDPLDLVAVLAAISNCPKDREGAIAWLERSVDSQVSAPAQAPAYPLNGRRIPSYLAEGL
ncbi:MAG: hypothetical protein AAF514_09550, partial [Verrucomicrobiota bacterium]